MNSIRNAVRNALEGHDDLLPPLRGRLQAALARLRFEGWSILQTAVAASTAWYLTTLLLDSELPFFASIAAIVSIGVTFGQRGRRAIELVLGVAFGLAVATLLIRAIGAGAIQIGVVVALAVSLAIFFGGKPLFLTQTAISAMLVVALESWGSLGESSVSSFLLDRFIEALLGSSVALVVSLLLPTNPRRAVEETVQPIFDELVTTLEESAAALATGDANRAEGAFRESKEIDERLNNFKETLTAGYETARFAPPRRQDLRHLELYAAAATQIDLAVSDVQAVARAAARAVRHASPASEHLSQAISDLARAVEALATHLEEARPLEDARQFVFEAAEKATAVVEEHRDMATGALVGQIRATTVDLLMGTGLNRDEALQELEEFVGHDEEEA